MAETPPSRKPPGKPIAALLPQCLGPALRKQGFASAELVTRWEAIVGPPIARVSAPMRILWPRIGNQDDGETPQGRPGTLVLRVEGVFALEIQHRAAEIAERVNAFFGWRAIEKIAIRQAPVAQPKPKRPAPPAPAGPRPGFSDEKLGLAVEALRLAVAQDRKRSR